MTIQPWRVPDILTKDNKVMCGIIRGVEVVIHVVAGSIEPSGAPHGKRTTRLAEVATKVFSWLRDQSAGDDFIEK